MSSTPYRIGLIGFGNIGTGVVRHLMEHAVLLGARAHGGLELVGISDKEFTRARGVTPPASVVLTTNWKELTDRADIDGIIELVGVGPDGKPKLALEIAKATLAKGKDFITANKALISDHGAELQVMADDYGGLLLFEAAVGAGLPLFTSIQNGLAPDQIVGIHGIVNGTCNYILTRLEEDKTLTLDAAIREAQQLGYAEPDPSFDVGGMDAAYKISILASLGFGQELHTADVNVEGITRLGDPEFVFAREHGYVLKLLATAQLVDGDRARLNVGPCFIPAKHILAGVRGVFNAVLITGVPIGDTLYYGAGAGQNSTGSGILSDVILASRHRAGSVNPYPVKLRKGERRLASSSSGSEPRYLRIRCENGAAQMNELRALEIGQPVGEKGMSLSFLTPALTDKEYENLVGRINSLKIPLFDITHVRFALGASA